MNVNDLIKLVTEAAGKIHTAIGPGCFKQTYEEALYHELSKKGLLVERQVTMPVLYEGLVINEAFKVDLLIEQNLVILITTVERIMPVHFRQLKSYLKLLRLKNVMLLNFKTDIMKDGILRMIQDLDY